MLLSTSLLVFAALARGQGGSLVLNEIVYDDSGTDDRELIELYNASSAAVGLDGWWLEARPASGMPVVYPLPPGLVVQPGGYLVLGGPNVPGVHVVLGAGNLLPDDGGSLGLRDARGQLVDGVAWEGHRGVGPASLGEGTPLWGEMLSLDAAPTSWSRLRDGWDTGNNGRDFRLAPRTAGTTNDQPVRGQVVETFDAYAIGATVPGFGGSFKPVRAIDPTAAGQLNPRAIPASPQGGRAAVLFDEAGGGNACMLLADVAARIRFEAWVYFDATPAAAGEWQAWTIGLQGTTSSFYGRPDPGRAQAVATANGNTGLGWTYVVDQNGGTLFFVDDRAGGDGHQIVTAIPIVAGSNDGWQRLRIFADAGEVFARFGGSYGGSGGILVERELEGAPGGLYFGYGDNYGAASMRRPLTLDALQVGIGNGTDPILTINGGSGCQGNCPVRNGDVEKVTEVLGVPGREYAMLVESNQVVNMSFICFYTGRFSVVGADPIVRVYADTGSGPAAAPLATRTMPVPASSGLAWFATSGSPFAMSFVPSPTARFWISIETDGSCYLPIATAGSSAQHYHRNGGAWTLGAGTDRWAWQLVCPDTTAVVDILARGEPLVGRVLDVGVQGAVGGSPVALALGASRTLWNGLPLPLDLGPIGAPTCRVNVSPDVILPTGASGMGSASIGLPIPQDVALVGQMLFGQWYAIDLRANALHLVTSERVDVMIGS